MDILHQVLLIARDNKLFRAPITRQSPRIMDLGAGTGIWAIQVADEHTAIDHLPPSNTGDRHLTPGFGYVEQVEIDWTPRWDDDDKKPADSQFQHWAELFLAGMDNFNRSAGVELKIPDG
ncbi:methyl transferase [Fusarium albosuccineum]|uniref:Methyl transferase n=1 Tax=Fusarium albosuccineum TaxID=1237068 RepID=A0A8H4LPS4_9HYPO|nr:methyl transferase [Fusarium albosuccineum]